VRLWDVKAKNEISKIEAMRRAYVVAYSEDGKRLMAGGADCESKSDGSKKLVGRIRMWDAANGMESTKFKGHPDAVKCGRFSPDGKFLATGGLDKAVRVWDVATGDEKKSFQMGSSVWCLAFSHDGKRIFVGLEDSSVRILNLDEE
jgi:WD40 repeat protein